MDFIFTNACPEYGSNFRPSPRQLAGCSRKKKIGFFPIFAGCAVRNGLRGADLNIDISRRFAGIRVSFRDPDLQGDK